MTNGLGRGKAVVAAIAEKAKVRKGMISLLGVIFFLQLYFVRELLAAELLFGLGFAALFVLGVIIYMVGALGERGLDFAEVGIRVISETARRGYIGLEEFSRKPFRHPRSESAQ
ncbi:MAG: hypothetical protein ACRD5M_10265 [Candidatus Acidiferrales bacterium]